MQLHLHICQQILTYLLYINISWYLLTNALAFSFNREMPSAVTINIMWNHRLFLCRQSWIIPVSVLIYCDGTGSKLHIKVSPKMWIQLKNRHLPFGCPAMVRTASICPPGESHLLWRCHGGLGMSAERVFPERQHVILHTSFKYRIYKYLQIHSFKTCVTPLTSWREIYKKDCSGDTFPNQVKFNVYRVPNTTENVWEKLISV